MGISSCNRIMTFARVECAICSDAAEVFVGWDLIEKIRKHRGVADTAACHFNCAYLQCFFVDPDMYLTPKTAFETTMLARIPLALAFSFDSCAVDKQV